MDGGRKRGAERALSVSGSSVREGTFLTASEETITWIGTDDLALECSLLPSLDWDFVLTFDPLRALLVLLAAEIFDRLHLNSLVDGMVRFRS